MWQGELICFEEHQKEIAGPGFLINVPVYLEPLAKETEIIQRRWRDSKWFWLVVKWEKA